MHNYTETEEQWLRDNHGSGTYEELADRFRRTFNCDVTFYSIKNKCRNMRLAAEHHPFTPEQDAWLDKNYLNYENYEQVTTAFNAIFHAAKKPRGIQSHCVKFLHLVSERQAFKKGMQTWNKNPIGHEYVSRNGYTYVKISDTGVKCKDYTAKHRLLWEQYHGCLIPTGYIVVFLNSDRSDFSKDNLYCIPRNIGRMMNTNGWFTENREHTLAAIKWCELFFAMKNTKRIS